LEKRTWFLEGQIPCGRKKSEGRERDVRGCLLKGKVRLSVTPFLLKEELLWGTLASAQGEGKKRKGRRTKR